MAAQELGRSAPVKERQLKGSAVQTILCISLGAILGANARYILAQYITRASASVFPYATLVINCTGSFVLGFFLVWTTERVLADPRWRLFIAIGFCGSYTTFSSYAYETFALFEQGQWGASAINIIANNALSLIGVLAGAAVARALP